MFVVAVEVAGTVIDGIGVAVIVLGTFAAMLIVGIVLIRTFLSFSLELEITGAWPWQKRARSQAVPGEDAIG